MERNNGVTAIIYLAFVRNRTLRPISGQPTPIPFFTAWQLSPSPTLQMGIKNYFPNKTEVWLCPCFTLGENPLILKIYINNIKWNRTKTGSPQQLHATGLCGEPPSYSKSKASCSGPEGGVIAGEFLQLKHLAVQLLQQGHGISKNLVPGLWERCGVW